MAIEKIKYKNKVAIKNDESLPEINKVTDENMNEIKKVINNNADELSLIKNQIPTGQATGNPIHIADSSNLEAKLRLNGGDKQVVTELGENILDSTEYNGIGITEDTNTGFGLSFLPLKLGEPLVPGNYSFAMFFTDGTVSGSNVSLNLYDSNNSLVTTSSSLFNFTEEQIAEIANYRIFTNTTGLELYMGKTIQGVMLVKGSTKPSVYKEFIHASPTPNNPSKVETVGSNVNLFDKDNITESKYIDAWANNGNYGNTIDSQASNITDYMPIIQGKNYVFSYNYKTVMSNNNRGYCFYDEEKQLIVSTVDTLYNINLKELKFTAKQNGYVRITCDKNFTNIKFEQGNKATPYSPYGMGSVEINVRNKNWFVPTLYSNNTKIKQTNAVVTLEKDTFIFECIDGDMYFGDIVSKGSKYTENIGNLIPIYDTSILSVKVINEKFAKNFLTCFDENLISLGYKQFNSSNILNNYSLPEGTKYVTLRFGMSPSMATIGETYKTQVQIEAGELTEYEKYQSQTKIMYTQQEMLEGDYIEDVEHHTWKKIILNGTENITQNSNKNLFVYMLPNDLGKFVGADTIPEILSNQYSAMKFDDGYSGEKDYGITFGLNYGDRICIRNKDYNTVEEFKTALATNNLIIYYKLATPLDLELTEEQKETKKINTYKNITNIAVDNNLATLDVTYKKDQNTVNQNYENRIAALEAAILS